ncbi:NAD synthetase [hydrothermal vent metagenome]|uniref:NAD synthetase n=1 Tax=hydrothermal vent metagenome TaxID=652676 RepID=A0A3B1E4Y5_9ZZZZ
MNWQNIKSQMTSFLEDEVSKTGLSRVVVGLSGGLDSAIVATLCKEVFKNNLLVVLMPSYASSKNSTKDAIELCNKFDIKYEIVYISNMIKGYFGNIKDSTPLRIGNLSARMRMSVLYDISARDNALVVGTSNKSEILLGYGTLYGDTACAINPIGQMYKSDAFEFAKFLGIPNTIINKKPSADLWEGQSDEEELGYSYKIMDDVLKELIDNKEEKDELIKNGVNERLIDMLEYRIKANKFKSKLPTIANISFD